MRTLLMQPSLCSNVLGDLEEAESGCSVGGAEEVDRGAEEGGLARGAISSPLLFRFIMVIQIDGSLFVSREDGLMCARVGVFHQVREREMVDHRELQHLRGER